MIQPDDIDPDILAARALQAQMAPGLDVTALPAAAARAAANRVAMIFNDQQPALPHVETISLDGPGGALRGRIYQPATTLGGGAIFYIHGGGWFSCDVDTHDRMLRYLAAVSGLCVLGIDYRLSPEHPYPAALQDCQAGWHWLRANAGRLGIDPGRIAIAGDSAGANLALAVALAERDADQPMPAALGLFYGCFAPGLKTPSRARYGNGLYGLTGPRMDWYWANYLGAAAAAPPVLSAPFDADFRLLPPAYIGIAECDVLADENRMIAERMRQAGVTVELAVWCHATHGFLQMTRDVAAAREAVTGIATTLATWLRSMPAAAR